MKWTIVRIYWKLRIDVKNIKILLHPLQWWYHLYILCDKGWVRHYKPFGPFPEGTGSGWRFLSVCFPLWLWQTHQPEGKPQIVSQHCSLKGGWMVNKSTIRPFKNLKYDLWSYNILKSKKIYELYHVYHLNEGIFLYIYRELFF